MGDETPHLTPPRYQRLLSAFSGISPHFRPHRHRLRADVYRREMTSRFATWNDVSLPQLADTTPHHHQGHPAPRNTLATLGTKQLDNAGAGTGGWVCSNSDGPRSGRWGRMRSGEEIQGDLREFVARLRDYSSSERGEARTFFNELIHCYGADRKAVGASFEDAHPATGSYC
jgi:hypothetical protein